MPFCIGWVENFDEIALSCTVKEIEANFCFSIFRKNLKIQNGRHFWEEENFLKIAKSTLLRYPVGRRAIFTKSNPMQAINPINTHTKFGKDRINTFPSNERKPSVRTADGGKSKNNTI